MPGAVTNAWTVNCDAEIQIGTMPYWDRLRRMGHDTPIREGSARESCRLWDLGRIARGQPVRPELRRESP